MRKLILALLLFALPAYAADKVTIDRDGQTIDYDLTPVQEGAALGATALQPGDLSSATNSTSTTTPASVAGVKAAYDRASQTVSFWDYIPEAYHAGIRARTNTTDMTAYLAAAVAGNRTLIIPDGKYNFDGTVTVPVLTSNFALIAPGGQGNVIFNQRTADIPILKFGTWNGGTTPGDWYSTYVLYYDKIKGIQFTTTSSNCAAVELRGVQHGEFSGLQSSGFARTVDVLSITAWNHFTDIEARPSATRNPDGAIYINGNGDWAGNSTGNIYTGIRGLDVKNGVIYGNGQSFGDITIQGVQGTGVSTGGAGTGGQAKAAVWFNGNGGTQLYFDNIGVTNVQMDGYADAVVLGEGDTTGTPAIKAIGLVAGGNVDGYFMLAGVEQGDAVTGTLVTSIGTPGTDLNVPTEKAVRDAITAGASGLTDPGANGIIKRTALNTTAAAASSDVVALFGSGSCTGYLKNDGTCDTSSGMVYPGAGVPNSTGSAWGTSYAVGTTADDLVQLDGTGKLPAVDGSALTNMPYYESGDTPSFAGITVAPTWGANAVTNGTFDSDLTGWTGTNWSYSGGKALHTAGSTAALQQLLTGTVGTPYKVTFDVSGLTAGSVKISSGNTESVKYTANGTGLTYYFTPSGSMPSISFSPSSDFDGAVDNVTLQAVTAGDSTFVNAVLNAAGYVGLGTTTPSSPVEIIHPTGPQLKISDTNTNTAGGGGVGLYHRNASGAPLSADRLGYFLFGGYDGTAYRNSALIGGYADGAWTGGSAYPTYLVFATTAAGSTSRLERVRVHGSGGVSIGSTTDPGASTLSSIQFKDTAYAPSANTAFTVDLANGMDQELTTSGNVTITLPTPVAGKSYTVTVKYGGTHTVTWAGGGTIKWAGGAAPMATSTNGKYDVYVFKSDATSTYTMGADGGRNY